MVFFSKIDSLLLLKYLLDLKLKMQYCFISIPQPMAAWLWRTIEIHVIICSTFIFTHKRTYIHTQIRKENKHIYCFLQRWLLFLIGIYGVKQLWKMTFYMLLLNNFPGIFIQQIHITLYDRIALKQVWNSRTSYQKGQSNISRV